MFALWLFLAISVVSTSGLNIISRAAWGARPSTINQLLAVNPPSHVVIHHSGTPKHRCTDIDDCKRWVRSIQAYHIDTKKWGDVGYNFLIGADGNVYEGRGWSKWGAHSPGFNKKSIGISLMGDYTSELPPQRQIDATKDLIAFGVKNNFIAKNYKLVGHRQDNSVNTACPGNKLFEEIQRWDHFVTNV